jgi:hypothetical protein
MPIYLAPYVGTGKFRVDPFRPYGYDEPGWSSFDLRKDCTKLGKCLVEYQFPNNNYRLTKIAEHGSELEPWVKTLGFDDFHLGNWSWHRNPHQEEFIYEVVARDFLKRKNLRPRLIAALGSALIASILASSGLLDWKEILLLLPPFLTLPATDNFSGSAADLIDPPWKPVRSGINFLMKRNGSSQATPDTVGGSFDAFAYWDSDTFNNNQYSQSVFKGAVAGSAYVYIICRATGQDATQTYYWCWTDGSGGDNHLFKTVNNAGTDLQNIGATYAVNDLFYIEASGTTIKVEKNGVQTGTNQTDSSISSGAAGIGGLLNVTSLQTNWEGGNIASSTGKKFSNLALLGVGN